LSAGSSEWSLDRAPRLSPRVSVLVSGRDRPSPRPAIDHVMSLSVSHCGASNRTTEFRILLLRRSPRTTVRNMPNFRKDDLGRFAAQFKALANLNRLRIFLRLVSCCEPGRACEVPNEVARRDASKVAGEDTCEGACVGDLGADMGLAPSTVSFHIKELHQAGLIQMKRSGQRVECWIPSEVLETLSDFFSDCCTGAITEALELSGRSHTRS
jgi:ArsR family transcriptional regulator